MGDISAEPSMEEILSSIKRIIAEEGDTMPGRQRRNSRATSHVPQPIDLPIDLDDMDEDEILELSDPMPMVERMPPRAAKSAPEPTPSAAPEPPRPVPPAVEVDPIVSRQTAAAARAPLEALTRMMVKPEPSSDGTLEGLVREMLRPMLREWIDANVPGMVEDMVAKEIAKITQQG